MYRGYSISVLIPCFNEELTIAKVISSLPLFIDDIIIIDNGSNDNTALLASESGGRVISLKSKGYGLAYKFGFNNVNTDIIVTLDGDGEHPSNSIPHLIDYFLDNNLDFVSASRFPLKNPKSMNFKNIIGNSIQTFTMNLLFGSNITDSQSGMWVLKKSIIHMLNLTSDGMSFSEEIKIESVLNKNIRFSEFKITYLKRRGKSKLSPWWDGIVNMSFLVKRWLRTLL